MAKREYLTSESVTEGHPDKICDQVSDAILDAVLQDDTDGRVACEAMATTGLVFIAGEITTKTYVDMPGVVREVVRDIGYDDPAMGFDYETCAVVTAINKQSPDIAQGVDPGGAGDQGMMFGFACSETPELMPLPIMLAHKLVRRLTQVRKEGALDFLRPDGKSQVTVEYADGRPVSVNTVLVSTQHSENVKQAEIRDGIIHHVIDAVIPGELRHKEMRILVNPTGRFVIGGPQGDTGLTGRKIIVDTYGGVGSHGGGCFSGKDPTKVDRSGSYAARYIAKNVVAAGLAEQCEVQLAYAIGEPEPVCLNIRTRGGSSVEDERVTEAVRSALDLTPRGLIERLSLLRPIYRRTAAYGHFGREEKGFTWEELSLVETLKKAVG
ncbi:S-adenosylmethionine synthetase [candidate division TA06 bacterium DG_24]|uniref:S-adenosylmethionine synthase n=3 Tax=Bacteria division TA06 TaxID=1156500 RepID=A0A0S8JMR3_UNCT6|nr:MAG: S-adenosylmethionine synthetase [candidate division TA06 bacterium DG_24]KPK69905.1 MAG: S-adenosylmethionine synthetase [candidate division TA06 bacterium SM23_40]KPL10108.1 MAG: S-adenosylmethionine synthetase [candidate division TA06 bacterium SM1_40]